MKSTQLYTITSLVSLREMYPNHLIYPMGRVKRGDVLYLNNMCGSVTVKHSGTLYKVEKKDGKFVRYVLVANMKGGEKSE